MGVGLWALGCRRWLDLVFPIPANRIGFQIEHYFRQRLQHASAGLPAQQRAGAGDVDGVMLVRHRNHPRLDEWVPHPELLLHPGAGLGDRLRDLERGPLIPIQNLTHEVLDLSVADRLRLTQQHGRLRRQAVAPLDGGHECVYQVIQVQIGGAVVRISGEEVAGEAALVNTADLLREHRMAAPFIEDAADAGEDHRRVSPGLADPLLRPRLRFRVRPPRLQRPLLGDLLAGTARRVDQHGAGEEELLHIQLLPQHSKKLLRAPDVDLVVPGIGLPGEVVERGQMHEGGDLAADTLRDLPRGGAEALVGAHVHPEALGDRRSALRPAVGQAHYPVVPLGPFGEGLADAAADAGDEKGLLLCHGPNCSRSGLVYRSGSAFKTALEVGARI